MNRQISHYISFFSVIVKAHIFSETKPLIVGLNVTNRCNLACTYCYGDYSNRKTEDFTKDELLDLIKELHNMGTRVIFIGGGEPLLREDIGVIIDTIKNRNMLCFLNTNGILLPNKIKSLKGLDSLTISLDGNENSNDINRGKGTFLKIIKAIKVAKDEGLKVTTNTVINNDNINSIDFIISLAQKLRISAEFNLPYEQSLGNRDNPTVRLKDEQIKTVLKKLIKYKRQDAPISFSNTSRKYVLKWPFTYEHKIIYTDLPANFKSINCYMGRFMCLIDSDGFVYPCGQLIGKFPALNIHEVGFKQAWKNLLIERTCRACYNTCFTELNYFFGLNPSVLLSTISRFYKRVLKNEA